ncbi:hypothetical protein F1D05_09565 [Kribbella qitaiheensis]|uniref:Uncharacterized protein n=1 Tax=Kribbella qitaiheensis TaxID=1544730 RepID=A0A7G6WVS3_9ACTN|nr:hypothetical protein [Kribbella qitaiheensis]QNE18088.1 hypothetical protein F1D05_09565 [Kribbella qitaiheensis]
MAMLKGKGAMTSVNLLAKTFNNNVTKDGRTRYLDVQIDHRDPRGPSQTNLHLVSQRTDDGLYNNGAPYSKGQFDKIVDAAGPNSEPILKDGQETGRIYAIKANVMPASKGSGLVLNSETLTQSDFKIDAATMDGQYASMKAAREAGGKAAAQQDAGTPATAAQATAEHGDVPLFEDTAQPASTEELAVG